MIKAARIERFLEDIIEQALFSLTRWGRDSAHPEISA